MSSASAACCMTPMPLAAKAAGYTPHTTTLFSKPQKLQMAKYCGVMPN
jgi:hypothetical protein